MCLLWIRKLDLKEGIKLIYISLILDQTFFSVLNEIVVGLEVSAGDVKERLTYIFLRLTLL